MVEDCACEEFHISNNLDLNHFLVSFMIIITGIKLHDNIELKSITYNNIISKHKFIFHLTMWYCLLHVSSLMFKDIVTRLQPVTF